MRPANNRGFALMGTIFFTLLASLFSVTSVSLLSNQSVSAVNLMRGAQASAIQIGASEYVLKQIQDAANADWSALAAPAGTIALGDYTFSVTYTDQEKHRLKATIDIASADTSNAIARSFSFSVQRLPKALRFAIYSAGNAQDLELRSGSVVSGNVYNEGDVTSHGGSQIINGKAYVPQGSTIEAGLPGHTIANAPTDIPLLDTSGYDDLINTPVTGYNALISQAQIDVGNSDRKYKNETVVLTLASNERYRNITTEGTVTIEGEGMIIAWRDFDFLTKTGSVTINPTVGDIVILAGRSLTKTSNKSNRVLDALSTASGRVIFYARCDGTGDVVEFRGDSTTIDSALILSARKISIDDSANVTGESVLYVPRGNPSSGQNNFIEITDTGTEVSGSVISLSDRVPNLRIRTGSPTVTGLVYSRGAVDQAGRLDIDGAVINGSVLATHFRLASQNNRVEGTFTWDSASLPTETPEVFQDAISITPDSWEEL